MDKMKSYRPLKSPPRPESIKILSPFGEKLLMILRENRLRDNTISYHGNSQINTRRGFGNDDIMQQMKRWDDGNPNKQLNFTGKNSTSVPPFSRILEAKSTADSLVNTTGRFNSRLDSTGPTDRPNSTAMNSYNRPSNVMQQSFSVGSTQNRINLKRTSIFAEELGSKKKICNKFQVPLLRQTQLKNNIPKRNSQQNNFLQRIGNKATEKRLGVMEIELGKPCSVKKTTQKTIGDFFAAPSTDKTNNNSEEDDSEEESVWQTKLTQLDQTTMKSNKHSSPRFVSSIINSNDNDDKSEESFFTTIDDLIGVKSNNLNAGDEEDNYTVDMFADEEMKNTRTIESNGTGIEKIRNKLMKFRRSDDNDV